MDIAPHGQWLLSVLGCKEEVALCQEKEGFTCNRSNENCHVVIIDATKNAVVYVMFIWCVLCQYIVTLAIGGEP